MDFLAAALRGDDTGIAKQTKMPRNDRQIRRAAGGDLPDSACPSAGGQPCENGNAIRIAEGLEKSGVECGVQFGTAIGMRATTFAHLRHYANYSEPRAPVNPALPGCG